MDSSSDQFHEITLQMTTHSDDTLNKELRKELFKAAMSREWKKLLQLYKDNKQVQSQKITRAGDTVLHVAMSGAPEMVSKLLKTVHKSNSPEEIKKILGSQNEGGDTPLHLAAALGLDMVCWKMVEMWPEIVTMTRNNLQETPLFTAVRHGKKEVFFVLEAAIQKQRKLTNDNDISHCRRKDGDNILHYAIKGEHFDLAYEIIHLYPQLVNVFNSSGESALHFLANMPSVFKSGIRFGFYDKTIYHCTLSCDTPLPAVP